jgi:ABC-type molybdate transport system substrate-binding protein
LSIHRYGNILTIIFMINDQAYLTEPSEKDKYDIVGVLPREISTPVPVVGFISTHASNPVAAKALLQYLASPDAAAIWNEAGYEPHS